MPVLTDSNRQSYGRPLHQVPPEELASFRLRVGLFDVDGTLRNSSKVVPADARDALRRMTTPDTRASRQIQRWAGFATGRPWFAAEAIFRDLPINGPCILCAGAAVMLPKTKQELLVVRPDPRQLLALLNQARQLHLAVEFFTSEGYFVDCDLSNTKDPLAIVLRRHAEYLPCPPQRTDLEALIDQEMVIKAEIIAPISDRTRAEEMLRTIPGLSTAPTIASSDPDLVFINIMSAEVSRAAAVDAVLTHLSSVSGESIGRSTLLAVGDGESDIPTFECAEVSVAMGNANETVKRRAHYITSHVDQGGFAYALSRFQPAT